MGHLVTIVSSTTVELLVEKWSFKINLRAHIEESVGAASSQNAPLSQTIVGMLVKRLLTYEIDPKGKKLQAKLLKAHDQGLVSILKKHHDDLDTAVAEAFNWPTNLPPEQQL